MQFQLENSQKIHNSFKETAFGKMFCVNSCGFSEYQYEVEYEKKNGNEDTLLIYLTQGTIKLSLNQGEMLLKAPQIILIPEQTPYKVCYFEGCERYWMHFDDSFFYKSLMLDEEITVSFGYHQKMIDSFLHLFSEFRNPQSYAPQISSCRAMEILSLIARFISPSVKPLETDGISYCLHVMHSNFKETATVEEYAKISGLGKRRFVKEFREKTGVFPLEYINELRIDYAKTQIADNPDITFSEIARKAGFKTYDYFSRLFMQHTGFRPREYKQSLKNT